MQIVFHRILVKLFCVPVYSKLTFESLKDIMLHTRISADTVYEYMCMCEGVATIC